MDIPILVAMVVAATEFIKKAAANVFKLEIKGGLAVALAVLVSVGVVFVQAVKDGIPIGLGLLPVLIQVAIYSTMGYSIATKARA